MTSDIVPDTSSSAMRDLMDAYGVSAALGFPMSAPVSSALYRVDVKGPSGQSFGMGENVYAATVEDANTLIDQIFARRLLDIVATYAKEALLQHGRVFKQACPKCRKPLRWKTHSLTNAYAVAYWIHRGVAAEVAAESFYITPDSPAARGELTVTELTCRECYEEAEGRKEIDLMDYPEIFEHDFIMSVITSAGYQVTMHRIVLSTPSFDTEMSSER